MLMAKAIAHPTDSRLLDKSRQHLVKRDRDNDITLCQNYSREAHRVVTQVVRYAHAKQYRRWKKIRHTYKIRVGRVHQEINRKINQLLEDIQPYTETLLQRVQRILTQKPKDNNKL